MEATLDCFLDSIEVIYLNGAVNGGDSNSDDEVMVGEDEDLTKYSGGDMSTSILPLSNGFISSGSTDEDNRALKLWRLLPTLSQGIMRPLSEGIKLGEPVETEASSLSVNPFDKEKVDGNISDLYC